VSLSGWLLACARGWKIARFFMAPLWMLTAKNPSLLYAIDGWHQVFQWTLLSLIGGHLAAVVHLIYYRDAVMRRMLKYLNRSRKEVGVGV
jgi:cytochrome b561